MAGTTYDEAVTEGAGWHLQYFEKPTWTITGGDGQPQTGTGMWKPAPPMYKRGLDSVEELTIDANWKILSMIDGGTGASEINQITSDVSFRVTGTAQNDATRIDVAGVATTIEDLNLAAIGTDITHPGGGDELSLAGYNLLVRKIAVANDLSGGPACVVKFDVSGIQVSTLEFPMPFNWFGTAADSSPTSDNFYFGSGAGNLTQTTFPEWSTMTMDKDEGYWIIPTDGYYHIHADISINCTVSPSIIKNYILTTTGYGGVEGIRAYSTTVIRTNIDPHLTIADYIGWFAEGIKVAIKCDTSTGLISSERASSAWIKRLA
jgi:hypothetical protein